MGTDPAVVDQLESQLKFKDLKDPEKDDPWLGKKSWVQMLLAIKDCLDKESLNKGKEVPGKIDEKSTLRKETLSKLREFVPDKLGEMLEAAGNKVKSEEDKMLQQRFLQRVWDFRAKK